MKPPMRIGEKESEANSKKVAVEGQNLTYDFDEGWQSYFPTKLGT